MDHIWDEGENGSHSMVMVCCSVDICVHACVPCRLRREQEERRALLQKFDDAEDEREAVQEGVHSTIGDIP